MSTKLTVEDFEVLRGPLESGRQSPSALAGALVLSIFLQALLFALEYFMAGNATAYPYKDEILKVHFWITAGLMVLSLIYAIPAVYKRSGKIQYLVTILVAQNLFSVSLFISALFLIALEGEGMSFTPESLLNFTYILLLIGLLVFIATSVRFYILLRNGHYRKGSKKDELRGRFETKSYIPAAVLGGIGLVFVIQYIARTSVNTDINGMVVIVLGVLLFFVMLFILPEQLVILYCKFRFKSFNFNERGRLYNEK
ncbi:hypothetical protein FQ087_13230 [Sporosarcina sp. ANT_H38]|uniref:hypothetical protein n=1 Tax=Sporosarcina sp. ANT_H38 TaxID=2597358 RepID=UPI0011F3A2FF|nr:hypothetical protein [Sporosarcina sp. ANT_H38]KAA0955565.1 hypothetical protein FQ087_13230 [Sporosarcina sp. ANT_H38]